MRVLHNSSILCSIILFLSRIEISTSSSDLKYPRSSPTLKISEIKWVKMIAISLLMNEKIQTLISSFHSYSPYRITEKFLPLVGRSFAYFIDNRKLMKMLHHRQLFISVSRRNSSTWARWAHLCCSLSRHIPNLFDLSSNTTSLTIDLLSALS